MEILTDRFLKLEITDDNISIFLINTTDIFKKMQKTAAAANECLFKRVTLILQQPLLVLSKFLRRIDQRPEILIGYIGLDFLRRGGDIAAVFAHEADDFAGLGRDILRSSVGEGTLGTDAAEVSHARAVFFFEKV